MSGMKKVPKEEVKFVLKCISEAVGVSIDNIISGWRSKETVAARGISAHYLHSKGYSPNAVGEAVGRERSTTHHAINKAKDLLSINDSFYTQVKEDFDSLINLKTMEKLLQECERRQEERNEANALREEQLKELHRYNRMYKKVVVKLIKTPEKMPKRRDFALLEHILTY